MISTKIEFAHSKIRSMADLSDLAEMLFPGNRNQQYAFLVIWISLKWTADNIVPNLAEAANRHGVSKRTLERVRAKMKRMGLIDHVSRFNARYGHRDRWILARRFEHSLKQLAEKVNTFKDISLGSKEKDRLLLQITEARREANKQQHEVMD